MNMLHLCPYCGEGVWCPIYDGEFLRCPVCNEILGIYDTECLEKKRDDKMNIEELADIYDYLEDLTRQKGKTTALVEACLKINGKFIVHNYAIKKQLEKEFPELDVSTYFSEEIQGTSKPLIFDHFVLKILFDKIANK